MSPRRDQSWMKAMGCWTMILQLSLFLSRCLAQSHIYLPVCVSFSSLQAIERERPEKYRKLQEATRTAQTLVEQGNVHAHSHACPVCPHGNAFTCPSLSPRLHRNTEEQTDRDVSSSPLSLLSLCEQRNAQFISPTLLVLQLWKNLSEAPEHDIITNTNKPEHVFVTQTRTSILLVGLNVF